MLPGYQDYRFTQSGPSHMHAYLMRHLFALAGELGPETRVLDVGCGNGFACGEFLRRGCQVVGIDLSRQGIEIARKTHQGARFEVLAADERVLEKLIEAPFDLVLSTEVVEHLYAPRNYAQGCFRALKPGGKFVCTTPYHGYAKNLLLSLFGKWDTHADPLWDGGHIKLWSRNTLTTLLTETGFTNIRFRGVGRVSFCWMTMVMSGDKPASDEPATRSA